jgi:glycosyltransferase involved in cell wall biosynthesis
LKVFIVNPSLFAPHYDYHLCRALVEIGDSVTMVGRPFRRYEQLADEPFEYAGMFYRRTAQRETDWRTSRVGHILKGIEHGFGLRALEKLTIDQRAEIVHFQWLVLPFLDRVFLRRFRRRGGAVLTVHNAEIATHSRGTVVGGIGSMLQSLGQTGAALSFDRYVVHSAKTADHLVDIGINSRRIICLPHPPLELAGASAMNCAPVVGRPRDILFFGTIKPYKGVDVLIEAGIVMAAKRRDFRITIAGRPYQSLESLRDRIVKAGADDVFRFDLNFLPDARLAEYLADASIVVFPYREIDGSGALSHAVKFGKPIVASRVGGFDEPPFRDCLELVAPDDAGALATKLTQLLDEPVRLQLLADKVTTLLHLLPTWTEYARACQTAYRDLLREKVNV